MQRQNWPVIWGIAAFSALAAACAFYIIVSESMHVLAVAGAILVLAAGQVVMLLTQSQRLAGLDEKFESQGRGLRSQGQQIATAVERIEAARGQIEKLAGRDNGELLAEVRGLREMVKTLTRNVSSASAAPAPAPAAVEQPAAARATAPRPADAAQSERIDLLLEPVIELATGETVHYRALVSMVNGAGEDVPHAELMSKASAGGMRAALDVHVLKVALPVLQRLRGKHPAMRLLVPLGGATLAAEADLARLLQLLEDEPEAAHGIVFDIAHGDLAGLNATGIQGLARLARLGCITALSNVSVAGLDLAALRQLGVRFLDIDASTFESGYGLSPAWAEFAQFARAMQFQLIGGNVASAQQSAAATRVARFGYGPYFAPPRRVRGDIGRQQSAQRRSQAA